MDAAYVARYADLYRHHWWWRARETFLLEKIAELAPAGGFGPLLDVGCGAGLFFDALSAFGEPSGVEADAVAVSQAGRWQRAITLGLLNDVPRDRRFGLITLLDVIEHIEDDRTVLAQAAGRLAPSGMMVVTVPALPAAWTHHDVINHHFRRYRRAELRSRLLETGLELVDLRYFFAWPLPAKLLVRAKERLLGVSGDPLPAVPPRAVNRFLRGLSRFEQKVLPRPPLGTSLLAIARRA